ncbi:MAG: acyl-CoA thioesterase [Bacteroidales bacterium]|nr:acyl-CoA thioesterase [Bacteroidales bacterium]
MAFSVNSTIRVRYGETDSMGYAHHGNYPLYFEEGRTELIRKLGTDYKYMEEMGILMPVVSLEIKYLAPVYYDDVLTIKTTLLELPVVKIIFEYEITNVKDEVVCRANTMLAFVDAQSRKPIRAPEWFLSLVKKAL